jgi:hypothetical protein
MEKGIAMLTKEYNKAKTGYAEEGADRYLRKDQLLMGQDAQLF